MSIFTMIGGLGQGLFNYVSESKNRDLQLDLQRQSWAREDTAVQRRTADLEAAGINPILAAGQAASTMSPISTTAPRFQGIQDAVSAIAFKKAKEDITKVKEEVNLAKVAQAKNLAEIDEIIERKRNMQIANDRDMYNLNLSKEWGVRTDLKPALFSEAMMLGDFLKKNIPNILSPLSKGLKGAGASIKQAFAGFSGLKLPTDQEWKEMLLSLKQELVNPQIVPQTDEEKKNTAETLKIVDELLKYDSKTGTSQYR